MATKPADKRLWPVEVVGSLSDHQLTVARLRLMGLPMPEAERRAALVRDEFDGKAKAGKGARKLKNVA